LNMTMLGVASHWRRYRELYSPKGSRCAKCGQTFFPVRRICPNCRREGRIEPLLFSGRGSIYTYTVIRTPPEGFEEYVPYVVALVQLEEGPLVTSQVVDCAPSDVFIGMPVETCFRKIRAQNRDGIIIYGFKFRPRDGLIEQQ
jgi:uncharacterized OB-fold protein